MSNNKEKHINIRVTKEIDEQIELIKKELEKENSIGFNRSQIVFMLIVRGIEKYYESKNF